MPPRFLTPQQYLICFSLLFIIYVIGLFVPLMDNDAAHHAAIALHMYLTGDYVNLIDNGKDYLDKPHLHFWLAALSYQVFGVQSFAYKLPSFLFTIAGTYATYRLGKVLYNNEVGKLSALIVASAFAYMLSNTDVRMDAILTACVALATWQLVAWVQEKRVMYAIGAAIALALGFCTKGHIAVFTPGVALLFYLAYTKKWKVLWSGRFLLLIVLFFISIAPVVYCYYLQYDLHPEKVIRGVKGRSGVAFILWNQSFERYQGQDFGTAAKNDRLFFLHSFLWAFAPWSLLAFTAFFKRLKNLRRSKEEWLTAGTFTVIGVIISLSGFKLPHYLNIVFPMAAVLSAAYLSAFSNETKSAKRWLIIQGVVCVLCLVAAGLLNVWMFPVVQLWVVLVFFIVMGGVIYLFQGAKSRMQQLVLISVVTSAVVFYLLNSNFYPQLLTYQGGNELAWQTKGKINPADIWYWPDVYSSSFDFYTATQHPEFNDAVLKRPGPVWLLAETDDTAAIKQKGYPILETIAVRDYEITRLKLGFLNPATRSKYLEHLILYRIK